MPIPPPTRYRPSNLTKEQRQSQLAAVYGVDMQELSHAELERMRQIVQQHDAQSKPMKTIDLNNPPREPYTFQKFPMMVYKGTTKIIVKSEDALEDAKADGFSHNAPVLEVELDELKPQYQIEASRIQEQLEQTRRGPGRPKNSVAA